MKLCIKATCRNASLVENTTMVCKTVRVGFPTADIEIEAYVGDEQSMDGWYADLWKAKPEGVELKRVYQNLRHDEWIKQKISLSNEPFWICDTDVIFYEKVEDWTFHQAIAGAYEPQHVNPHTGALHVPRIHTALMYIDPVKVRTLIAKFFAMRAEIPHKLQHDLMLQQWQVEGSTLKFYDTLAKLVPITGASVFDATQLSCYAHLHCGTYVDLIKDVFPTLVLAHANLRRGLIDGRDFHKAQDEWYKQNKL